MTNQCCYGILDWDNLLLFVHWNPINAKPSHKMKYASMVSSFTAYLDGISLDIHSCDSSTFTEEIIKQKIEQKKFD